MDVTQFSDRVRACERKFYCIAKSMLSCEADCEDAMQDALFKAWRKIGTLRHIETILTPRHEGTISDTIQMVLSLGEDDEEPLKVSFSLDRQTLDSAIYVPDVDKLENTRIEKIAITQTPFAEYCKVIYSPVSAGEALIFDDDTVYYATESGHFVHVDPTCSGMRNASALTAQQAHKKMAPSAPYVQAEARTTSNPSPPIATGSSIVQMSPRISAG